MAENEETKNLEQKKYFLRYQEKEILNSQIRENKLENQLKKLKSKSDKLKNNKKNILSKMMSLLIYDIVMLSIIFSFINIVLNNFASIPLLITIIYVGVFSIGIMGAYFSSKIERKIKKYYYQKKVNNIKKKIVEKEKEINFEKEKQEIIKKEITEKMNRLDNKLPKESEFKFDSCSHNLQEKNKPFIKIKRKTKNNKKY